MKAAPADQQRLLELQELDSALGRLAHRRRALPERAVLADLGQRLDALDDEAVVARTEVTDLARAQAKIDADVEVVRARMVRDQQRLDAGAASPKELVDLQSEVASLRRRQGVLEDSELEVMEIRESAEGRLAAVDVARAEAETARAAAQERLAGGAAEIDTEAALTSTRRGQVAPQVPADLLAVYDKVRAASGGVGAAALLRRRCEGCHLELAGSELRTVVAAAPDDVLRCENCRRILVRTPESGL